jgi:hypothetical protein
MNIPNLASCHHFMRRTRLASWSALAGTKPTGSAPKSAALLKGATPAAEPAKAVVPKNRKWSRLDIFGGLIDFASFVLMGCPGCTAMNDIRVFCPALRQENTPIQGALQIIWGEVQI